MAGVHKPFGNLVSAVVLNIFGSYASIEHRTFLPITVTLVAGVVLVVFYALSKKFFVEIHPTGGSPIKLLFKPNVIEGVPIDADEAMCAIGVIRDLVIAASTGVSPSAGVVPIAPAPSPMYWPVPIPAPSNFQPNAFQVTTDQATDDGPSEVIVEPDDAEQYEPSQEETEAAAQTLLSDAKQLAAEGNRRKAVEILKAIVTECPHTQAAL